jgi:hypothetical protein
MFALGKKPTHLLLGTRKSATSWIWKQFSDHPDVYVHPEKEIYFFNNYYDKGLSWYQNQFPTKKRVVLDTTPDYFYQECAERIKKDLPNAKLLVNLRNPIDRAYSHWKFGCFVGNCDEDFIKAWKRDWNRIRTRGLYDKHLESFLDHYKLDRSFLALSYDALLHKPFQFINQIYKFVGVPRHSSQFFEKKWMPGEISATGKEEVYKPISERKMPDHEYKTLKNYYSSSIRRTEEILGRKMQWLDS